MKHNKINFKDTVNHIAQAYYVTISMATTQQTTTKYKIVLKIPQ